MKYIITTLREFTDNTISFKKDTDEDRITISAYIGDIKVGHIVSEVIFDAYSYEFEDILSEEEFDEFYPESTIVKIEYMDILNGYKNTGIGSKLMKYNMEEMIKDGYKQFYLNASPMGFDGLSLPDLVEFYKKFGFEELLDQGGNVIMGLVL